MTDKKTNNETPADNKQSAVSKTTEKPGQSSAKAQAPETSSPKEAAAKAEIKQPAPAPQPAGDAVLRILTEVDVYVKYGLKNKALEHVQRVFELDPDNVEGRRRRKELFVDAGEVVAAVGELWWLARAAHAEGDAEQLQQDLEELLRLEVLL